MREKILLTLGECTDEDGFVLPDLAVPKLEALFTASQAAETQAMRGALKEARIELQRWLNYDECDCPAEGHLCGRPRVERTVAKIDTVLTGGK